MLTLFSFVLIFGSFYSVLEVIQRVSGVNPVVTRKVAHVGTGLGAAIFSQYVTQMQFVSVTGLFALVFWLSYLKKGLQSIHLPSRKTFGELVYPLGLIMLAIFLYQQAQLFVLGVLILAVPDTLAWLTGRYLNETNKTVAGSFVFWLSGAVLLTQYFGLTTSIWLAALLSITEYLSPYGLDNMTVPVAYTLVTFLL